MKWVTIPATGIAVRFIDGFWGVRLTMSNRVLFSSVSLLLGRRLKVSSIIIKMLLLLMMRVDAILHNAGGSDSDLPSVSARE